MRFRRRSFGAKRLRDPVMWTRQAVQTANLTSAAPSNTVASVFGATVVDAGIDQRLTLRRLKLIVTVGGDTVTDTDLFVMIGVSLSEIGVVFYNPVMTAARDRQADWLLLRAIPVPLTAASIATIGYDAYHYDIKAMRKVDENQVIAVSAALFRGGGGAIAGAQVVNVSLPVTSALFSRTRR